MRHLLQQKVLIRSRLLVKHEASVDGHAHCQSKCPRKKLKNTKHMLVIKISEKTDGDLCVSGSERPPVVLCSAAAVLRSDER